MKTVRTAKMTQNPRQEAAQKAVLPQVKVQKHQNRKKAPGQQFPMAKKIRQMILKTKATGTTGLRISGKIL